MFRVRITGIVAVHVGAGLLEAVDAAEANHGSATDEEWLKKEDA